WLTRVCPWCKVAASLGIHPSCLRQWRKEYAALGNGSFPDNGNMTEKDAEIARLRRENRRLLAEREILKKGTVFFANG
ncbi:MAG: transposase, partial [Gemmataceae bacterium]